jgi:glycerophosphoryl diester phosphodiesterase
LALSTGSRAALAATLLMAAVLAVVVLTRDPQEQAPEPTAPTLDLQAHRGGRGLFPENSIPAIRGALALGVTTLELDLVFTRDEILVLHHDLRLDDQRTRGPDGQWIAAGPALYDLLADELGAYDIGRARPGGAVAERFPAQQAQDGTLIPRLAAAVALAERQSNGTMRYSLEMKRNPAEPALAPDAATAAGLLAAALAKLPIQGRVAVQSFDWAFLAAFRQAAPAAPTVWLTSEQPGFDTVQRGGASPWLAGADLAAAEGSLPALVARAGGATWSPDYRDLRPVDLQEAHRLGLKVVVWTVNEPADMASLIELGVDGIVTDYPDRLRAVMQEKGLALPPAFPPLE